MNMGFLKWMPIHANTHAYLGSPANAKCPTGGALGFNIMKVQSTDLNAKSSYGIDRTLDKIFMNNYSTHMLRLLSFTPCLNLYTLKRVKEIEEVLRAQLSG